MLSAIKHSRKFINFVHTNPLYGIATLYDFQIYTAKGIRFQIKIKLFNTPLYIGVVSAYLISSILFPIVNIVKIVASKYNFVHPEFSYYQIRMFHICSTSSNISCSHKLSFYWCWKYPCLQNYATTIIRQNINKYSNAIKCNELINQGSGQIYTENGSIFFPITSSSINLTPLALNILHFSSFLSLIKYSSFIIGCNNFW